MNKAIQTRILVLIFSFAYCILHGQSKAIYFKGYQNKFPVFHDDNRFPFILEAGIFKPLKITIPDYFLINIKDENILYTHNIKRKYILSKNGIKYNIDLEKVSECESSFRFDSLVYVEGDIDNEVGVVYNEIKFYEIKSKKETGTGVRGLSPFVVENYVYFMEYSVKDPQESTYGAINLKRFKINNAKKIEDILDDASRSSIYVIPGNKYIITSIQFRDASIHYTVYDIEKRKFAVFYKKKSGDFYVFWDYQSSKICFYDPHKMTFDYWSLPSEFPNNRSDKKIYFFNQNGIKN